ncbi:hypothetical protein K2Y11_18560, partial [bacterium]|nr:hypothetical protein [bacterium]
VRRDRGLIGYLNRYGGRVAVRLTVVDAVGERHGAGVVAQLAGQEKGTLILYICRFLPASIARRGRKGLRDNK